MRLTVAMASFQDFHRTEFTVQALRMYQDMNECEILVVDNYGCDRTRDFCNGWGGVARYIRYTDIQGTAAPRQRVFDEARGDAVLCIDSHVLLAPGVVSKVWEWFQLHPDSKDMLQGPMLYDDLRMTAIAMDPEWRDEMYGTWKHGTVEEPTEIPMHGLGLFAMRKAAWPGFNPAFRGFGGEEGYIHEKVRRAGGKVLCMPWLKWWHCFHGTPNYKLTVEDKFRNYLIGHRELDQDAKPVIAHFAERLPRATLQSIIREIYV